MPTVFEYKSPKGGTYKGIYSNGGEFIEKVDPLRWLFSYSMFQLTQLGGYSIEEAHNIAIERLKTYASRPCPDYLKELITEGKKKRQERLFKDQVLTPEDLITWFLYVGRLNGTFSEYSFEEKNEELEGRMPLFIDASDPNNIVAVGKTDLSEAALKHLVEHQNKKFAQIIDLEDGRWFCFYRTHRGLSGRETGDQGSHMHFISSAYGISREDLVEQLKSGEYPTNGYHVHFQRR